MGKPPRNLIFPYRWSTDGQWWVIMGCQYGQLVLLMISKSSRGNFIPVLRFCGISFWILHCNFLHLVLMAMNEPWIVHPWPGRRWTFGTFNTKNSFKLTVHYRNQQLTKVEMHICCFGQKLSEEEITEMKISFKISSN